MMEHMIIVPVFNSANILSKWSLVVVVYIYLSQV